MAATLFPVTVLVDRLTIDSPWATHRWQPAMVLPGATEAAAWTILAQEESRTSFLAGVADLALYPRETETYKYNIESEKPAVYVILRRTEADPGVTLLKATVCPGEAHALNDSGDDIVEPVPMPQAVFDWVSDYVAANHAEQETFKRKRDRADPEALGRRRPQSHDDDA